MITYNLQNTIVVITYTCLYLSWYLLVMLAPVRMVSNHLWRNYQILPNRRNISKFSETESQQQSLLIAKLYKYHRFGKHIPNIFQWQTQGPGHWQPCYLSRDNLMIILKPVCFVQLRQYARCERFVSFHKLASCYCKRTRYLYEHHS